MHRLALLFVPLAACTDTEPVGGGDVVGTWEYDDIFHQVITFDDDGTCEVTEGSEETERGTYEVGDGRLTLALERGTIDVGYYADDEVLLFAIAVPDDDGADAVATWRSHSIVRGESIDTVITLAADQRGLLEVTDAAGVQSYDGTWAKEDGYVNFVSTPEDGNGIWLLGLLHAGFLGTAFERVSP